MEERCIGDNDNVRCPHCGKLNHDVCEGVPTDGNNTELFCKKCYHCKKMVYYRLRYVPEISASAVWSPHFSAVAN